MYPSLRALQKALGRQEKPGDGFILNGNSSLQSLARFYGLRVPTTGPRSTLADYLVRTCSDQPRVGDRTLCDRRVELVVQEIENGTISKVYLRIMPGWSGERRGLPDNEGARGRRLAMKERRLRILPGWLAEHPGLRVTDGMQGRRHATRDRRAAERRDIRL